MSIYFVQSPNGGPIKIGTSIDAFKRKLQLQWVYDQPLDILAIFDGGRTEEEAYHTRFASLRFGRTEQFRPGPALGEFLGRDVAMGLDPETVNPMANVRTPPCEQLPPRSHYQTTSALAGIQTGEIGTDPDMWASLDIAFTHLNGALFDGMLPTAAFHYDSHIGRFGWLTIGKYVNPNDELWIDDIAFNPDMFGRHSPHEAMAIIARMMVSSWQTYFGKIHSRPTYFNHEWADKMLEIGLFPTSTGKPGGRMVGQRVAHIIIPDGRVAKTSAMFLEVHPFLLPQTHWTPEREIVHERKTRSKTKYTCPRCGTNAWAKPDTQIRCDLCNLPFQPHTK